MSSGSLRGEAPSLNGHHGDCGTNATTKMMADDAVDRSSKLTWLRRCLLMVVGGLQDDESTWPMRLGSATGSCGRTKGIG